MSWEEDFYKMSDALRRAATESVESVLLDYSKRVLDSLREKTPVDTGDLRASLKIEEYKGKSGTRVGYRIVYDGYDANGRPYQVIANSLNRGFVNPSGIIVSGTHFIDISVSLLRGMDDAINVRWRELADELIKGKEG